CARASPTIWTTYYVFDYW
nr:immunoglobulin heavy chain junction region [Macaca mulatta]MOV41189.1 immunoglobulin heavy chain junction region [Macaca mulatta]MOV47075.1 immunoglobulin heavy chain junction region [Macaca mulatta]